MPLAFQAPVPTVRKLEALGGNKSDHLRKALDLYMMVLKEESLILHHNGETEATAHSEAGAGFV